MKIVADQHIPFVKDYFATQGDLILKPGRIITAADVKDADMLLVRTVTHINEALLSGSRVKFIGSVTAGADHLDTAWLEKAGIPWHVAAGFNAPPVADYVVSVIAALQRKGLLQQPNKTAAVIGVGNVGRIVKAQLERLQFKVIQCDPFRANAEPDFASMPLDQIADVDLISLHVPLTSSGLHPTRHMIDATFLQRQQPDCVIINASRGSVINADAFLVYGEHLHACFDVWPHEPNINAALLTQALIATPHIAGYSVQSKIRGIDMIYQAACQQGLIKAQTRAPVFMPQQELTFTEAHHAWQDIALGIFNPLVMTAMMRAALLPLSEHQGEKFDELRHQFNHRYEFGFTTIAAEVVKESDRVLLKQLGLTLY